MTITITDQDLEGIAAELESWPYTRAPRLYDLDYAIAVSEVTSGREGELDSWHEITAWLFDILGAYFLLAREHHVRPYADDVLEKLEVAQFRAAPSMHYGPDNLDAEDFEGTLASLTMLRMLQGDRTSPRDAEDEDDA